MPTTPNYALPYQSRSDTPHGPNLGEDLALAVDAALVSFAGSLATTDATAVALAAAVASITPRWAVKTADESVTSSTTLQDDNHLFVTVDANAVYEVRATVFASSAAAAAGDITIGYSYPAGALLDFGGLGPHNSLAAGSQSDVESIARIDQATPSGSNPYGCSTSVVTIMMVGTLTMSTTAGTLTLRWAQQASNANATTVKAGSTLRVERIA